ncbi:MAG: isoprenylcysteine carboxylmethyltransferase family protein [Bacteroidales bacterium]|nr:isoprenylcysteine carboxylmethyltransferase family protein [Bacteroidales bacterium]
MRLFREILAYLIGGVLFVGLIPFLMWLCSMKPELWPLSIWRIILSVILIVIGLALSIWAIVYMRRKGDGNPLDAFGHEVAPRTKHLMTDGPYRLSRNPMLSGIFLYLIGICLWLWTWQSVLFFVLFVIVMSVQVYTEEKRLRRDFGEEYEEYCRSTGRFFPKLK